MRGPGASKRSTRSLGRHAWLIGLTLLLVIWTLCAELGWIGPTLLASPGEVLAVFARSLGAGDETALFSHAAGTIGRALAGWGIAVLAGLLIGAAFGVRTVLYDAAEPLVELARAIPPIMVFPLLLVAFNYGGPSYVWTIVFGCLPVMILTVARGTRRISRAKMELLAVFETTRGVRALAATLEVLPSAVLGARITLSIALVVSVVTEMVFTPRSGLALGALAKEAEISFNTPLFYAALVLLGTFGYVANIALRAVEVRLGIDSRGART